MELEKIKAIIAEVLNIDADSITEDKMCIRDRLRTAWKLFQTEKI